jgi:hypothetical protein
LILFEKLPVPWLPLTSLLCELFQVHSNGVRFNLVCWRCLPPLSVLVEAPVEPPFVMCTLLPSPAGLPLNGLCAVRSGFLGAMAALGALTVRSIGNFAEEATARSHQADWRGPKAMKPTDPDRPPGGRSRWSFAAPLRLRSPGAAGCSAPLAAQTPRECGRCDRQPCAARGRRAAARPEKEAPEGRTGRSASRSPLKKADVETLNDVGPRKAVKLRCLSEREFPPPKQMSL